MLSEIAQLRLEILKTCFRPGNNLSTAIGFCKEIESYILSNTDIGTPDETKQSVKVGNTDILKRKK